MKSEVMTKVFGKSYITRQVLEDMPYPVYAENITDEQMQELANYVESEVRKQYPEVADKLFEFRNKGINGYANESEYSFLYTIECDKASILWWELVEEYAVKTIGAKIKDSYFRKKVG